MSASWNKDFNFSYISDYILSVFIKVEDQVHVEDRIEYEKIIGLLHSCINFTEEYSDFDKTKIIKSAVESSLLNNNFNQSSLIEELSISEEKFKKQKFNKFIILTTLSLKPTKSIQKIHISDCTLIFTQDHPKEFYNEDLNKKIKLELGFKPYSRDYCFVKIFVKARSYSEAIMRGVDALNLWRGITNFYLNVDNTYLIHAHDYPINKIKIGPLLTLHKDNGDWIENNIWHDSSYKFPLGIYTSNIWPKIKDFDHYFRRKLRNSRYCDELRVAILRYVRALDEHNAHSAFLKLWSLLEYLTNESSNNFKDMIKKVSYLYRDRNYQYQILKHLQDFRNSYVHSSEHSSNITRIMIQTKRIVEDLLEFHLFSRYKFNSIDEFNGFLRTLSEKNEILKNKHLINKAANFLGIH